MSIIFRPDADPETSSVDGYILSAPGESSWADVREGVSDNFSANDAAGFAKISIKSGETENTWVSLSRSIVSFDTSTLPDDISISSATLSLHGGAGKDDELSIAPSVNVYAVTLTDDTDLLLTQGEMEAIWDSCGSTAYCDTAITFASWNTSGWNSFILNATGLAAISKTGNTRFSIREVKYDVSGTSPTWFYGGASDDETDIYFWAADYSDGSYAPKLTVTYPTSTMTGGNLAVVETRIQYVDAYSSERYWLGIEIGASDQAPGNITVVENRVHYVDTLQKERYIKGIPV